MVTAGDAPRDGDDPKPIRNENLAFVFKPARDHFPAKPYYEDGDPSMYTTENMNAREDLRENPRVREAILDFATKQFVLTGNAKLCTKDEYVKVFMKVGQILRSGIEPDELQNVIREDFDSDSQPRKKRKRNRGGEDGEEEEVPEPEEQEAEPPKNPDALTEEQLHDALFEMADTWCPSISEDEYIEFFEILHQKMLYSNQQDSSAYDVLN